MRKIFRFDDVCLNTDMKLIEDMSEFIFDNINNVSVVWGVSPLMHDMSYENQRDKQRTFPKILNAYSDYRIFFNVDRAGIPEIKNKNIIVASHGLVHVDHRLLTKEQQEMSILISSSLCKSTTFIPPFNKWDKNTEEVCKQANITLIKFEEGWLSMEHNHYNKSHFKWYLHSRAFSLKSFKEWFNLNKNELESN
jgi:hypothetical protein